MRLLSHNRVEPATKLPSMQVSQDPALGVVPFLRASEEIRIAGKAVLTRDGADGNTAAGPASASPSKYMLSGLGLATWMEFCTYDGVNLELPATTMPLRGRPGCRSAISDPSGGSAAPALSSRRDS